VEKMLVVNLAKCCGCRTCENVCSLRHDGTCNPALARIGVVKWELEGIYLPVICQHCEEPQCAKACPAGVITRHPATGAMVRDRDRCLGCKACLMVCPFGAPTLDLRDRKPISCDLCDGDPTCVQFCPTEALEYVKVENVGLHEKRHAMEKLRNISELTGRAGNM
jgi:Fe-S-cluster-containing hydrogenase component 2